MKREILVINQIKEFLKTEGTMEITEQKILHSAKKLFLTLGYHKTTMIALANQAEVNKALIYYYFSDKETLYKIVIGEVVSEDVVLTLDSLNKDIPFYFKIKVFGDFRDLLIRKYPHLPVILISPNEPGHQWAIKALKDSRLNLNRFAEEIKSYIHDFPFPVKEPKAAITFLLSIAIFPYLFKDIMQLFLHVDNEQYNSDIEQHMNKLLYFIDTKPART